MSISDDAIYWFRDDDISIVVHKPSRSRIVLDQSADLIWRLVAACTSREQIIHAMIARYRITRRDAEIDLDEFVDELRETGILEITGS